MDALKKITGKRQSTDSTAEAASGTARREVRSWGASAGLQSEGRRDWRPVERQGGQARTRVGSDRSVGAAPPPRRHWAGSTHVLPCCGLQATPTPRHSLLPRALQAQASAASVRATADVQQQFKELTLSPAQREGKEPVFEGRVTGARVAGVCVRSSSRQCGDCCEGAAAAAAAAVAQVAPLPSAPT